MDALTNPFYAKNLGAPPPRHGMGMWIPRRGLMSSAYLPSRWERLKIKDWWPYQLTIPGDFPGIFSLPAQSETEFSAAAPVYFCAVSFSVFLYPYPGGNINQNLSVSVELYHPQTNQALINPNGPPLDADLLGGDAKNHMFFGEFFFMDPGDTLLARLGNINPYPQQGQIVVNGFRPVLFGVSDQSTGPEPSAPLYTVRTA